MVQLSQQYVTTGNTIAMTVQTFVSEVMSLLIKTLCRFDIVPAKKKSSYFMATVTNHSDFGAQEEEICHCFHLFLFYVP